MEYKIKEIVPGTVLTTNEMQVAYRNSIVPNGITFVDSKTGDIPQLRALFSADKFYIAARDLRINK